MRNFSIVIHEHMEREIPVNIRKPLADSDETLPSPKKKKQKKKQGYNGQPRNRPVGMNL